MDFFTMFVYICVVFIGSALWYVWYMTKDYDYFKKMGIKGPKPSLILGNLNTMTTDGAMVTERKWYNEYKKDKVFGIFEAKFPVLFVTDIDLLKEILIKKFHCFVNKRVFDSINDYPIDHSIMVITDDHWRHVRNLLTPTFSTGKLKKMIGLINDAADNMVDSLRSGPKEQIDIKGYTGSYTMDVIGRTAFGIDINSQADHDNDFVKGVKAFVNPKAWIFILIFFFPFMAPIMKLLGMRLWPKTLTDFFVKVTDKAIKQRRSNTEKSKYNDFLQLMMNAEVGDEDVDKEIDHRDSLKTSIAWSSKGLTTSDIHGAALTFFAAGYDTTATTLAFTLYELALHPDICDKAIQEVDTVLGTDSEVTYEHVTQLQYLEMCVSETLRVFPPAIRFDRMCNEDVEISGIQFKKGMVVAIPAGAIHYDPEYWPEPEKYDPERFTPEAKAARNPCTYLPFGLGPRNCIGMRLAQMETKLGLARLLQTFRPIRSEKTEVPIKLKKVGLLDAENGFWMKLEPRKKTD